VRGAARLVAAKDFRLRLRDRSFFIIGIIAPLALAFIFNATFGPALGPGGLDLALGLVDEDRSEVSASLRAVLHGLADEGLIDLEEFGDGETATAAVDDGTVDAFIRIPAGFGADVETGSPVLEVVGGINNRTSTAVAAAIARQFAAGIDGARLAVVTTANLLGVPPGPDLVDRLEGDPASAAFTARIDDATAATRQLDATTYLAAGMAVFFMFFTVQTGVIGLLEEEREGTLQRLLAAPVGRGSVIAGKALLSLTLGVISLGVLVVASSLLMGADWGHPLGVAVMIVAVGAAAVALIGVVAGFSRSPEGAGNLASMLAVILGMLGGVFFPIGQGGNFLSRLTALTPHHWFMRGLGELGGGAEWTVVLVPAAVLLAMAAIGGVIGWWVLTRRLAR
jgi:ABC-2 type transport system permease protein